MNKADIIEAVRSKNGFSQRQAEEVVNLFFNEMACALAKGKRIEIRGFGSFFVKRYRPYIGRNPKTGRTVKVRPKKLPLFRCGRELRIRVDGIQSRCKGVKPLYGGHPQPNPGAAVSAARQ